MLTGESLWSTSLGGDLVEVESHGRRIRVFPDAPATLYVSLAATAGRTPHATALVADDGSSVTFAELFDRTERFAATLIRHVAPGDRVALMLGTSIEFAVALYAANRCGAVVVPIPTKHKQQDIETLVGLARPRLVIAESSVQPLHWLPGAPEVIWAHEVASSSGSSVAAVVPPYVEEDADCILMYTSGTTSRSKGVLLTNRNVCHAIVAYQRVLGLTAEDSGVLPVPIYHITGTVALLGLFVHLGARLVLHRRFDADRVLRTIRDERLTFLHASPTVFALLLAAAAPYAELPSLRMLACGAAHMPVSRIEALHAWLPGMEFRTIYGLTETSSPALVFPCDAATSPHIGSSGWPIPGLDVEIRDDEGNQVVTGERGHIWLRGTNLLRRYDNLDPETLTADGWLDTGDIGYVDEASYVSVVDRSKDMINRGGEKVWCIDVEEELRRLPGVIDAAVVGVPSEVYGEEPAALLVLESGHDLDADTLTEALRSRLARYQLPRHYLVADQLPVTANLKIDKVRIRALFATAS